MECVQDVADLFDFRKLRSPGRYQHRFKRWVTKYWGVVADIRFARIFQNSKGANKNRVDGIFGGAQAIAMPLEDGSASEP